MINKIKESLEKATPKWYYNGNEIVSLDNPKVGIGGFLTEDDNHLAANAPEWIRYLIEEVERLQKEKNEVFNQYFNAMVEVVGKDVAYTIIDKIPDYEE